MTAKRKTIPPQIPSKVTFPDVIAAMLDESKPFHPRYLYHFSDIEAPELHQLETAWSQVTDQRRRSILEDVEELGETNLTLSFEDFCRFTVTDSDPRVRELSLRVLWDYESSSLVPLYLDLLANDNQAPVRAMAATALGKHVYLGETEDLPQETLNQIVDRLLVVYRSSEVQSVRRNALESLGYSSREEVNSLIENAYHSGVQDWIASSLVAMSRTAHKKWEPYVLEMLESDEDEVRYEAVRAAGELEIKKAKPLLMEMLDDSSSEIRMAAVWSLSQIGGEGVEDILMQLYEETEDEEEADFIDLALDNLSFTEDLQLFTMFEYLPEDGDEEVDEGWDEHYDLDGEDD
jgi:HEAT repeats